MMPQVAKLLRMPFLDQEAEKFIVNIIISLLNSRKDKQSNDFPNFLDVFVAALENNSISEQAGDKAVGNTIGDQFEDDAKLKNVNTHQNLYSTKDEFELSVVSNLFLLFFAGFDTTSTAMASVFFYLATNPEGKNTVGLKNNKRIIIGI